MKVKWTKSIIAAAVFLGGAARAQDGLQERLDVLERRTKVLERKFENDQEVSADKGKTAASPTANGADGFTIKSPDKSFAVKVTGYLQADGRFTLDDAAGAAADQFLIRRARPIVEGTLYKAVEFRIVPDFGGGAAVVQDAFVNLKYWPQFQLRAGRFKVPFGLERLQSNAQTLFVEAGHSTSLTPNYDVGLQLHGELWDGALGYALGAFNGASDGSSADGDNADGKDLAARVFALPFKSGGSLAWKDLGVGFAATRGRTLLNSTSTVSGLGSYKTPGQQTFFTYSIGVVADGDRVRWSPQAYWYPGPFGLLTEYVVSRQDVRRVAGPPARASLTQRAWQVQASYALTGETASYKGLKPRKSFDPAQGTWGAWEVGGRYSEFRADTDAFKTVPLTAPNGLYADKTKWASRARTWSGVLNWYLNGAVKVQTEYDYTWFTGGAAGKGDKLPLRELLTRFQVAF